MAFNLQLVQPFFELWELRPCDDYHFGTSLPTASRMTPRLIAASPEQVRLTGRKRLTRSFLHSKTLGPQPPIGGAGFQKEGSGTHHIPGVSILLQFNLEILNEILSYLEPIWLFQLEGTCKTLAAHVRGPIANKIWYNALPSSLLTYPEHFQDEARIVAESKVEEKSKDYIRWFTQVGENMNIKQLGPRLHEFPAVGLAPGSLAYLPKLKNVSVLGEDFRAFPDTTYLSTNYPIFRSHDGTIRKRNLAVGGIFQPQMSYRREILGHLHQGRSCSICFEEVNNFRRKKVTQYGLVFCNLCLTHLMVPYEAAKKCEIIVSLMPTKTIAEQGYWSRDRAQDTKTAGFWRYHVDDILRKKTGLNYETMIAKEAYISQLVIATDFESAVNVDRQKMRLGTVEIAKQLWTAGNVERTNASTIESFRDSFAPAERLHEFLFAPHLLDADAAYLPYDIMMMWLDDPTMRYTGRPRRGVRAESFDDIWKTEQANSMLRGLVDSTGKGGRIITALVNAAQEFHIQRLHESLSLQTVKDQLKIPTNRCGFPQIRMKVLLSKMHLMANAATAGIKLTHAGRAAAKKEFPKLFERVCTSCPTSGFLAPRGVQGIVGHMYEMHPKLLWGYVKAPNGEWWTIEG